MNPVTLDGDFLINDDTPIYRYLSMKNFHRIIQKKTIGLSRISKKWEDPNEGFLFHLIFSMLEKHTNKSEDPKQIAKNYHNNMYGISWSLLSESDAMWRIYSPNKHGVQIISTVGKLNSVFKSKELNVNYSIGKILYENDSDNINNIKSILDGNINKAYFIKKEAFKHEEEVRGVAYIDPITDSPLVDPSELTDSIDLSIENSFIEGVTIDPRSDEWFVDVVMEYCNKKEISNCMKSELYKELRS